MADPEDRISEIGHWVCGCAGSCACVGDEFGVDTEKAFCWMLARRTVEMNELDRRKLALAIAPELKQ